MSPPCGAAEPSIPNEPVFADSDPMRIKAHRGEEWQVLKLTIGQVRRADARLPKARKESDPPFLSSERDQKHRRSVCGPRLRVHASYANRTRHSAAQSDAETAHSFGTRY